jgi:hypothetical protein
MERHNGQRLYTLCAVGLNYILKIKSVEKERSEKEISQVFGAQYIFIFNNIFSTHLNLDQAFFSA